MYSKKLLILSCLTIILNSLLTGQNQLNDTRNIIQEWVETKQIISEEIANWSKEKELMENSKDLLSKEFKSLNSALDDLEASSSASDAERSSLNEQRDSLKSAAKVVSSSIGKLETKLKAIVPYLPEPLIEKIKPLVRRLPDNPKRTDSSLGQRVQNIVGILSQTDKFNTTITASSEARELENGSIVQVTTLYWGLGIGYYVDESGKYAGIRIPAKDNWEWKEIKGVGSEIKRLVDIYEGLGEIQFVNAPAVITEI